MSLLSILNSHLSTLNSLGENGNPLYADEFSQLNTEVFKLTEELFKHQGSTPQEEATLCIALLKSYSMSMFFNQDTDKNIQKLLDRSAKVLDKLESGILKCRLLLCCYMEIPVEELLDKANEIIMNWDGRELADEEKEVMEKYNELISV